MVKKMKKITVATFNIGAAAKRAGKYTDENLAAIADVAKNSGADIMCMQEVDRGCERSGGIDMPAYISKHAGYPYYHFIKIRDFQGGEYGTLILGKYPIVGRDTYNYPVKLAKWGTSAGMAEFDIEGKTLCVFNSHLSCENDEKNTETMTCYAEYIRMQMHTPQRCGCMCVATGDFNDSPEKVMRIINFLAAANTGLPTYSTKAIDNILYSRGIKMSGIRTVDTVSGGESDHRMLLCEIEF
jgi:endonuclease/exonuclease/phosphatase family metal-dependent hydrolase